MPELASEQELERWHGAIDFVEPGRVSGWVRDREAPGVPVGLRVLDHDTVIAEGLADRYREDLAQAGLETGHYGFEIALPAELTPHREHLILVQIMPGEQDLPRSPWPFPRTSKPLQGNLEMVTHQLVSGWALNVNDPAAPLMLKILDNGEPIAEICANLFRADLKEGGLGEGRLGFHATFPVPLSDNIRHSIQVMGVEIRDELPNSPWILEPLASLAPQVAATTDTTTGTTTDIGYVDEATHDHVTGWAIDRTDPEEPVMLRVMVDGVQAARVLANRHRPDLEEAGYGYGRLGYELVFKGGLSPFERHVIDVVRDSDGEPLIGSPTVIERSNGFDKAVEQALAGAVDDAASGGAVERDRVLEFIMAQGDRLLELSAAAETDSRLRAQYRQFRRRWGPSISESGFAPDGSYVPEPAPRALVVDERVPDAGRDAGSQAILSHMSALQRMGYQVSFVASEQMGVPAPAADRLEAAGIKCLRTPHYASVEEVLRRQSNGFDVIYLHRISNASRYLPLARRYCAKARIIYAVADLHHLRFAREAEVEHRPELRDEAARLRVMELMAASWADAVITHSSFEAELLRKAVRGVSVYVVPWTQDIQRGTVPFAERRGVAFIGSYSHAPNLDAAFVLAQSIMPQIQRLDPQIECLLVGSDMPRQVRLLAGGRIVVLGAVEDLATLFDRVRLTIAPLRFGAGVKGKVLASLAAGVPCVMSPIAAEGIDLPPALRTCVGQTSLELAEQVVRLHNDETANAIAAQAGLDMIARDYSEASLDAALKMAVMGTKPVMAEV